jgi:hypothetical protein
MRLFKVAAGKPIWATIHSSRAILERPAEIFRRFFPALLVGGRPQVPLRPLFQARAGTLVEPPTFHKPAKWLPHMKDVDPSEDRTYSGEGPVISSQRPICLSVTMFINL